MRNGQSYRSIAEWATQYLSDVELAIVFELAQNSPALSEINAVWLEKQFPPTSLCLQTEYVIETGLML